MADDDVRRGSGGWVVGMIGLGGRCWRGVGGEEDGGAVLRLMEYFGGEWDAGGCYLGWWDLGLGCRVVGMGMASIINNSRPNLSLQRRH